VDFGLILVKYGLERTLFRLSRSRHRDVSFRRTFATLLKGGGEDVKTVQELMRHASSRL